MSRQDECNCDICTGRALYCPDCGRYMPSYSVPTAQCGTLFSKVCSDCLREEEGRKAYYAEAEQEAALHVNDPVPIFAEGEDIPF